MDIIDINKLDTEQNTEENYEQISKTSQVSQLINTWKSRLDWTSYFMSIAYLSASRSPCHRLQVGCVIVKDKRIVCTGYNGFLPDAPHESMIIDDHEQATIHAEQNSVSDCAKRGVSINGGIAYVTHFPCINCFKILSASGIKTIIYGEDYRNLDLVYKLAEQTNITIKQYYSDENIPNNK
jgi:dCMP deaminase